jgi:hypothetical protein
MPISSEILMPEILGSVRPFFCISKYNCVTFEKILILILTAGISRNLKRGIAVPGEL